MARREDEAVSVYAIVLDDLTTDGRSTKRSDGPSLPTALSKPTFAVESSPGNHQFVYVLDKSATVDEAKDLS